MKLILLPFKMVYGLIKLITETAIKTVVAAIIKIGIILFIGQFLYYQIVKTL